ncbi:hypothetical protein [Endozoicomonas sp. SCSIO W0465]|uniref:hypothetical protein n=1 Tax=Endozoicomonas sp. SCSIO W0465 TaxID=2918516 RepID=UPI002074F937|nr:hypothetical protein [Endozoicomonas sp. SCSIO W0465]USE37708.1 hypothetical protein MJO57_05780 [Endozoicomonas sp. SCSIO W0465]
MKLASHQDNNECYFEQLKAFELPGGLHSSGHEEDLRIYRAMDNRDSPESYFLFKELLLIEAIGNNRLEHEFGVYFTPSSVWLTPVANKLKSLGCKAGIEVMGGKGYLSYFLKTCGFKMKVSDNQESHQHPDAVSPPVSVRKEDSYKTVEAFKDAADFLVISWPPQVRSDFLTEQFVQPHDYLILRLWGEKKPVLYVGERLDQYGKNGATGSHSFHHHLNTYFTACKFPEYQGRHLGSVDEAIIFIPNGKKIVTVNDNQQNECKQM